MINTIKDIKKAEMERKISVVKNFAKEMGYAITESTYYHSGNNHPIYLIELNEVWDKNRECYSWGWYTDTYEEVEWHNK